MKTHIFKNLTKDDIHDIYTLKKESQKLNEFNPFKCNSQKKKNYLINFDKKIFYKFTKLGTLKKINDKNIIKNLNELIKNYCLIYCENSNLHIIRITKPLNNYELIVYEINHWFLIVDFEPTSLKNNF